MYIVLKIGNRKYVYLYLNRIKNQESKDYSPMNRKDDSKDPEAQENYTTLISTSSTRARPDGKI